MATHSVFLPEEYPWTEEPGGLQSTGMQRVKQDLVTKHIGDWFNLHGGRGRWRGQGRLPLGSWSWD